MQDYWTIEMCAYKVYAGRYIYIYIYMILRVCLGVLVCNVPVYYLVYSCQSHE